MLGYIMVISYTLTNGLVPKSLFKKSAQLLCSVNRALYVNDFGPFLDSRRQR
jgi:hypothetical protein